MSEQAAETKGFEEIELKNVLTKDKRALDITVQVVPFDRYSDVHVDFAYSYSDMLYRLPSELSGASAAAKKYAEIFLVRTEADVDDKNSNYNHVINDTRACRSLFNRGDNQVAMTDFFENA